MEHFLFVSTFVRSSTLYMIQKLIKYLTKIGQRNRFAFLLGAAAFLSLLLFLRHPEGLLDANFWAEDGWVWYPDAYRLGLWSMILPHSGYLQTFSRIIAASSLLFPLLWAPTVFAVAAFMVRLLPPLLLLSKQYDSAWPSLPARMLMATTYICLPNSFEEFANVTNAQWHLGLAGFLLVTGAPVMTSFGKFLKLTTLTIANLSGPFCLLLLPIAAWAWVRSPTPQRRSQFISVGCCSLIQGVCLLLTAAQTRSSAPLGAGITAFARIFANQLELGLMLGSNTAPGLVRSGTLQSDFAVLLMTCLGLAACLAATWRGSSVFRMFALFGALVLAASLATPVVTPGTPAWEVLTMPGAGQRYFLIPMLVLTATGIVLAGDRIHVLRGIGIVLCSTVLVGIAGDWSYPPMPTTKFNTLARQFATVPVGTEMTFPLYPPEVTPMILVKR